MSIDCIPSMVVCMYGVEAPCVPLSRSLELKDITGSRLQEYNSSLPQIKSGGQLNAGEDECACTFVVIFCIAVSKAPSNVRPVDCHP